MPAGESALHVIEKSSHSVLIAGVAIAINAVALSAFLLPTASWISKGPEFVDLAIFVAFSALHFLYARKRSRTWKWVTAGLSLAVNVCIGGYLLMRLTDNWL
jgi:hypothetical protein